LPITQYGLPLGRAISLGIHESQSRLYENNLGRSLAFCQGFYPMIQHYFPEQFKGVDAHSFFKGINKVTPSPIRIESDELHYHFHIMIRYEIEKALIEDSLQVKDIPEVWNSKYKSYLGLDIADDNTGCIQDIHWSHGSIGYFPTYSLGSFYAAQFYTQAQKEISQLDEKIAAGEAEELLTWLRDRVHQHGQKYTADELCKNITGEPLNFSYFMDYAKEKYNQIYTLAT
ncbi:MAG: carboxypeptidase M32, partial [Bacteroidota bacterium]